MQEFQEHHEKQSLIKPLLMGTNDLLFVQDEIRRLENATSHLIRSNQELTSALQEFYDPMYEEAIAENRLVIEKQHTTVLRLKELETSLKMSRQAENRASSIFPNVTQPEVEKQEDFLYGSKSVEKLNETEQKTLGDNISRDNNAEADIFL
jgi:seryl-tRNA synthetase